MRVCVISVAAVGTFENLQGGLVCVGPFVWSFGQCCVGVEAVGKRMSDNADGGLGGGQIS